MSSKRQRKVLSRSELQEIADDIKECIGTSVTSEVEISKIKGPFNVGFIKITQSLDYATYKISHLREQAITANTDVISARQKLDQKTAKLWEIQKQQTACVEKLKTTEETLNLTKVELNQVRAENEHKKIQLQAAREEMIKMKKAYGVEVAKPCDDESICPGIDNFKGSTNEDGKVGLDQAKDGDDKATLGRNEEVAKIIEDWEVLDFF